MVGVRLLLGFGLVLVLVLGLGACGSENAPGGDGGLDAEDAGGGDGQRVCTHRADCELGEICQDGFCVADCPANDRCEQGGDCCPGDWECINSVCRRPCAGQRCGPEGEFCCEGDEVCLDQRCVLDCGEYEICGRQLDFCCAVNEICYGSQCTLPGANCVNRFDCPAGMICEPDLRICIDEEVVGDCLYHPPSGVFEPSVEWHWSGSDVEPGFDQVMMAPAVANLTDDNGDGRVDELDVPDVVFITFSGGAYNDRGVLRIVSGDGTTRHLEQGAPDLHPGSCPAIADLDGDGVPEIVVDKRLDVDDRHITGTYALRPDGSVLWLAEGVGCATGGPAIANLNADPAPEVITQTAVVSATGDIICTYNPGSRVPVAADLDLDGVAEVVTGRGAYRAVDDGTGSCEVLWELTGGNNPAIADFDRSNPNPEIVFPYGGQLIMLNHQGIEVWSRPIPLDMERVESIYGITDCNGSDHKGCNPGGGPPTVADFDGDGEPEIGLAARWYYLVYDGDGSVLWAHRTKDYSSAATGSSVFDFEGDGRSEVVYNDEEFLRVYYGEGGTGDADGDGFTDAEILIELPNPSGTLLEYPLVVDVDGDGRSEIVLAANNYAFAGVTGVRVFGDALDNWVGTRRIWNQHSYHVSNICDGVDAVCPADAHYGSVPETEIGNWQVDWLNNYRQNVQGEGLFWAPDLVVLNLRMNCNASGHAELSFDLMNQGSRMVPAGVQVSLYRDAVLLMTLQSSQVLFPGHIEHMSYAFDVSMDEGAVESDIRVQADDDGTGSGRFNECDDGGEDNNGAETLLRCGIET